MAQSAMPTFLRSVVDELSERLASVEEAVAAIAQGGMVVVVDAADRENEGDLVMAAEKVTPAAVNFMAMHGRGLICVPMTEPALRRLHLEPMVSRSTDPKGTAFYVSVDHAAGSTGISAADRSRTIRALADAGTLAPELTRPGHVFPLAYCEGGVLKRAGHTEASVDLVVLAGLSPAAVICEVADAHGEMAPLPQLPISPRSTAFPWSRSPTSSRIAGAARSWWFA
jgi:3,4-dihydroxy 2-butanone 4-phosphate synthase/GTP cyclohydrolase II